MKKKTISIILVFALFMSLSINTLATNTAPSTVPAPRVDTWSNWMEIGRYNSDAHIENATNSVILAAVSGGLTCALGLIVTTIAVLQEYATKDVYFTTVTYARFDYYGNEQRYEERFIYSDKARTKLIDSFTTKISDEWHFNDPVED